MGSVRKTEAVCVFGLVGVGGECAHGSLGKMRNGRICLLGVGHLLRALAWFKGSESFC